MSARELPAGWEVASISSLIGADGVLSDGDWIESKDQDPNGDVRLIQLADIGDGFFINKSSRFLTSIRASELGCTYLAPGDVLIARMPDPLGRACIYPGDAKPSVTAVDVLIARPGKDGVDARWLMHAVNSPQVRSEIALRTGGTTRQRISGGNLKALELWIPPSSEQRRIVEKIDALTGRSRRARTVLDSLPALIDRYRQSILASAFRGDLTEDVWENDAPQLTQKNGLHPIPRDWEWTDMRALVMSGPQNGLYLPKTKYGTGHPILRIDNFQDYSSDSSVNFKKVELTPEEQGNYQLLDKDIIINRVNAPSHLGKCMVVSEKHLPAVFESNMMRLRVRDDIPARYIAYFLKSPQGRRALLRNAKWAVNQASINQGDVLSTTIPLPPNTEKMLQIVARVESALTKIEAFRVGATVAQDRLATLDQSILAKAFRGELVPQDPRDEPASVLLERIRAERAAASTAPRRGRRART